jgi:hypothetical protein
MVPGVAFCPPAPFLVPGLAPALVAREPSLGSACLAAVTELAAGGSDRWLVVGPGRTTRLIPPGALVRPSILARSDHPPVPAFRLPGGEPSDPEPPAAVGTVVGAGMLTSHLPTATVVAAVEIAEGEATAGAGLITSFTAAGRTAVLAMVDGATSHGPDAPGAEDARSADVDDALAGAMAAGRPEALAGWLADHGRVAAEVGVRGLAVIEALASVLPDGLTGQVRWRGQPFGVGYLVATWLP